MKLVYVLMGLIVMGGVIALVSGLTLAGHKVPIIVTVNQLTSDKVGMNGKAVRLQGVMIDETIRQDKAWVWDTAEFSKESRGQSVSIVPVPKFGDYPVNIEGKYDGESNTIHVTSCKPSRTDP